MVRKLLVMRSGCSGRGAMGCRGGMGGGAATCAVALPAASKATTRGIARDLMFVSRASAGLMGCLLVYTGAGAVQKEGPSSGGRAGCGKAERQPCLILLAWRGAMRWNAEVKRQTRQWSKQFSCMGGNDARDGYGGFRAGDGQRKSRARWRQARGGR